jgi:PST family polysaccharide transporter
VTSRSNTSSTSFRDLKRKSVRGGLVTIGGQGVSIAIQLASTVILARLLSPQDYGIIAMVMAVTAFAGVFRDLGLSSAAIQKKDLTLDQQSNLFWLNVAMGALLTTLVSAASPLVAWFYGKPELLWVTVALSFSFLIGSFGSQHAALLVRNMQFGRNAIPVVAGGLASLAVSVALALQGWSYWSLVWGNLAGGVVTTGLLFLLSGFRPSTVKRGVGMREMIGFGANVTGFELVNYFHRNLDNVLIGKFWGAEALGLYSRAYQLLMFPITAIRGPINAVAFPAMSRLQDQPNAFRAYYRRVTQLLAFVSMPLTAFLFVASAPIVEMLLGREWLGVSPLFSLLALTAFIQPVAGLRGMVLLSSGQSKRYMHWGILNAVCVSIGFVIGVKWGGAGVAVAYAIVTYAILYPSLLIAFKNTPLCPKDFFVPIFVPVISSVAAVLITREFARADWISELLLVLRIVFLSGIFFTSYLICTMLLPGGWRDLRRTVALLHRRELSVV